MKKLLIKQCPDTLRWYAGLVGQYVDYICDVGDEYKSREPAGHSNFVQYEDAEIVDVEESKQEPENKNIEPFGYVLEFFPGKYFNEFEVNSFKAQEKAELLGAKVISVYDHPPMQKNPLSDDEINELVCDYSRSDIWTFARAIEKAHGIGKGKW